MSISSKRQGKAQAAGCWIRKEKRLAIYLRDGFHCVYCGTDLHNADPQNVTLDHLTPQSAGGSNEAHNLVTACKRCNCARGNRAWEAYAPVGAFDRIIALSSTPLDTRLAKAILNGTEN